MSNEITSEHKSHFLDLYKMALSDKNFGVLELQMLYHFAVERGVPKSELDKLLLNPADSAAAIPEDVNKRIEYLYHLACMILFDEIITEDERNTLRKFCRKFEFLDENVEELAAFLLNCVEKDVTIDEIINQINAQV